MFTAQGVLNKVRQLPEGRSAGFIDFGESKSYTVLVKRRNSTHYAIRLIKQDGVFDEHSGRYKDTIIHTFKRVSDDMLPYVFGKILAYEFEKEKKNKLTAQ